MRYDLISDRTFLDEAMALGGKYGQEQTYSAELREGRQACYWHTRGTTKDRRRPKTPPKHS